MRQKIAQLRLFKLSFFFFLFLICTGDMLYAQNLKVFIMAGQSNMEGHGELGPENVNGTLSNFMSGDGELSFGHIQNEDNSWKTRDDVWVRYDQDNGTLLADKLNIGFGGSDEEIGPELGFGHLLGDYTSDQVLIIKTCWGGKSLAVDFRPPSSGGIVGPYYNQMISDVNTAIANIATEFPQYTAGQIEIAGFVWFQGWNDGEQQAYLDEYEQNLTNLITDVRSDLNVPNLPTIVALTGNGGREIEAGEGWVNGLQTQLVPAQITATQSPTLANVSYTETRDFWRESGVSPEDALHHWNNNAESYLRIGHQMGLDMIELQEANCPVDGVVDPSVGGVQPNTNLALPQSYHFKEYVFAEPNDQGTCQGISNATADIEQIYLSQTHRRAIDHPLFYTIGYRPAVLQIAVTGTGASPDVTVTGTMNGSSLGQLCLSGPAALASTIDLTLADFENYFTVTLPKSWIKDGLQITVKAGSDCKVLTPADLKIGPYTEMNLVEVQMDILDYNINGVNQNKQDDLLEEIASAIPASVVRYGLFPKVITFPEYVVTSGSEPLLRFASTSEYDAVEFSNLAAANAVANLYLDNLQEALGDKTSTVFFGNTLNLNPGGWGGDRTFVAADYDGVFIHELGHALSLSHWGDEYNRPVENDEQFLYPYGGDVTEPGAVQEGGGIGETWTFIQHEYAFVSPTCEISGNDNIGLERSDCMQREISCNELRGDQEGPWEGFSDFSSYAMHQFMVGGAVIKGKVPYRNAMEDFQIPQRPGFPTVSLENGKRIMTRDPLQPQNTEEEDWYKLPGEELAEQDMYLLYGSIHPTQDQANIIYEPIKMKGTLLPNIDPTDPQEFAALKELNYEENPALLENPRDIILKLYYDDGTIRHAVVPYDSFDRGETDYYGIWRYDVSYFALTVPADKNLCNVELYSRPFVISGNDDDREGNINFADYNITTENFMDAAILKAAVDFACNCPGTPSYVLPGTPCNDGNPDTYNDVEDGNCNCIGVPKDNDCNFVSNGRFTDNLAVWWTWGSTTSNPGGIAKFESINPVDAGIAQGPFDLLKGDSYIIEFDAYATEDRTINVFVTATGGPFTRYFSGEVNLNTSRQSFSLNFTVSSDDEVELEFNFEDIDDDQGATIFLDQVSLRKEECALFDPCLDVLTVNTPVAYGFHGADRTLASDGKITSDISLQFHAGESVDFLPNFEISKGAVLITTIEPCSVD